MNIKLLFFPLSITIALAVSIFYIKPAVDTTMSVRSALAAKETFAEEVNQKVLNIKKLDANLNANKENEDVVLHYLPSTRDDDRVMDGINFLSAQAGLALTSVKITKGVDAQVVADAPQEAAPVGSDVIFSKGTGATDINQIPAPLATPKLVVVSIEGMGSYESIRDVIGKLSHEDRFQNFTSVDVNRINVTGQSSTDKPSETNNVLTTSITMNFVYLPKVNAKGNLNRPILNRTQFDFGMIQKLKEYTSAAVPSMEAGAAGTSNPFLR